MQLEIIDIEDVYPDMNNPRRNMGDITALAESMSVNTLRPGEPWTPIIVVRDGGIFRIVDGERRYRAMLLNKVTRCQAVVCEGLDDANAATAMVATDDKAQLTEEERSRGVQQMLLLGVDPVVVEKSAHLPKGSAEKLKRTCKRLEDNAEDLTLDRLFAIADFEAEGDTEAAEAIANYIGNDWQREVKAWREKREREAKLAELEAACKRMGLSQIDAAPDSDLFSFFTSATLINQIEAKDYPTGCVFVCSCEHYPHVTIYEPRRERKVDPEVEKRNQQKDEIYNAVEVSRAEHRVWYCKAIKNKVETPNIDKILIDYYVDIDAIEELFAEANLKVEASETSVMSGQIKAQHYVNQSKVSEIRPDIAVNLNFNRSADWMYCHADRFLEWLDAHTADGYVECWADKLLRDICQKALDGLAIEH